MYYFLVRVRAIDNGALWGRDAKILAPQDSSVYIALCDLLLLWNNNIFKAKVYVF